MHTKGFVNIKINKNLLDVILMSDERYDNIEYNEEWQSVPVVRAEPAEEEYDEDEDEYDEYLDDENPPEQDDVYKQVPTIIKPNPENPQPVIKLQFFLAFLVVAVAFLLKNFGGELYTRASEWYFDNLNNSLVITMKSDTESEEQSTANSTSPTETATVAQLTAEDTTAETQQPTESITTVTEPTEVTATEEQSTETTEENADESTNENNASEETTDEQNITDEEYIED